MGTNHLRFRVIFRSLGSAILLVEGLSVRVYPKVRLWVQFWRSATDLKKKKKVLPVPVARISF